MSRYLSYAELDRIAERVVNAYAKLPEVSITELLYVDPNILLRSLLGLEIEYRHLSPDGRLLGLTTFDEIDFEVVEDDEVELFVFDGKTVLIEMDLVGGRKNFTIVHEGCHHVLHMLFPRDYGSITNERRIIQYRESNCTKSREEWQVDYLTSRILMPRPLVEQAMTLAGLEGKIEMLNPVWRYREYEAFCNMCLLLGVSKQALALRMKQLGLLGTEHLARPYEIVDIWKEDKEIE